MLPTLTPEARAAALAKGAEVRKARAEAKADLTKGALSITDVLSGRDNRLLGAYVRQVLLALPGVGQVKADSLLAEARIAPKRRVGGLGVNQRAKLEELLAPVAA